MRTKIQAALRRFDPVPQPGCPIRLKAAICEEITRCCIEQYGERLHAIVLTGSLAREEATFVKGEERWSLLGDAEFLLIFREGSPLPPAVGLEPLRRKIEGGLFHQDMLCHISLSVAYPTYLRKLKPKIFAYELRAHGQVLWGDRQILSLIPACSASDIPLEDAWRLLCNRMIEYLEVLDELVDKPATVSGGVLYRTVKLYLDMATSYLLFAGAYEPTYRGRAVNLSILADTAPSNGGAPFPLPSFAERVIACTQVKLLGPGRGGLPVIPGECAPDVVSWKEALGYARQLWRWELVRLTGLSDQAPDRALLMGWMRLQPFRDRLRGWLSVLRRRGWHRSWRAWPQWGRRGWRASPRYWVYAASSELFFKLPSLVGPDSQRPELNLDCEKLRRWLPVLREKSRCDGRSAWRQLASEILFNYREFLEGTCA